MSESGTERVCLVDDNDAALLWRLRIIQEAKREIVLTTFELRDDVSGRAIMAALLEAAERNVTVRVLIDGAVGALRLHGSENFKAFCACPNVEVKYYNPLKLNALWKINYRLHDKYLIADNTAYILGGRNTHDIYLGHFSQNPQVDRELVVYEGQNAEAGSLYRLKKYFQETWNLKDCEMLTGISDESERKKRTDEMKEHLEELLLQYDYPIEEIDWYAETYETNGIALLTGEPTAKNKKPVLWTQMCQLMKTARKEVLIQTPLIVYDSEMRNELSLLQKNTEKIEVFTNGVENWINVMAAGHPRQKKKLLEAGVDVSEYSSKKSFHTKTILIDDAISIIGSYNMDLRSTYIDTEIMAVVDCPKLNADLKKKIQILREQGKTTRADGSELSGKYYQPAESSFGKKCCRAVFEILLYPFQYLL